MKNLILLICCSLITSCSYKYETNISNIIKSKANYDGKEVTLRGYLFIHQENMIQIYSSKDSLENKEHFDVILNNESNIVDRLYDNKFICVDLIGLLHAHEPGVIISGYLTSIEGIVTVKRISQCKKANKDNHLEKNKLS